MSYTHLTEKERYYIYVSLKSKKSLTKIAREIGRSKSSISRELKRNQGFRGYRYKQAEEKAKERQQKKVKPRIHHLVWSSVVFFIQQDFSPEQISGMLALKGIRISHEIIYQFILKDKVNGGLLSGHLRCQRKKKRRYGRPDRRGQIRNRVSIDERPTIIERRERLGDWEADTVEGKKGGALFVTLAERTSRLFLVGKVPNKSAIEVKKCIVALLTPIKEFVKTITFDNGKEFAYHEEIGKELSAETYFAHPYHSWERGTNENSNGLLRQYFPKGKTLDNVSQNEIINAMLRMNHRPRKVLDFSTPYDEFLKLAKNVALST